MIDLVRDLDFESEITKNPELEKYLKLVAEEKWQEISILDEFK